MENFLIHLLFSKFISTSDDGHMRAFCCGNAVTGEHDKTYITCKGECNPDQNIPQELAMWLCTNLPEEVNSCQTRKKLLEQSALQISSWRKLIVVKHGTSSRQVASEDIVIFSNGAHWNRYSVVNISIQNPVWDFQIYIVYTLLSKYLMGHL